MDDFQKYIHLSRYSRWDYEKNRRETWEETVKRYCDFWQSRFDNTFPYSDIYSSILSLDVMPSMRAMWSAGKALELDNIAGYNCSYIAIDHQRAFDEILYILCCGTGVGFSVEEKYVNKLPEIAESFHETDTPIVVPDSRLGWASSFRELIGLLYLGRLPKWNLSKLRPAGAVLKTFGGRSSGPEPLDKLFSFTTGLFRKAAGRKLTSLECHDLVCKIADVVVVGGVRRSALISLSNLGDDRIRSAKNGSWWIDNPQRALANNSAVYNEKPDVGQFLREWTSLYESKSGERGVFNRLAAKKQAHANGRRDCEGVEYGTNPCGEILLRPSGLCNLSEAVIRPNDNFERIRRKVEIATIIGTFQSTLTDFRYVRPIWRKNAEEERLLGVSLTGIMDHPVLSGHGDGGFDRSASHNANEYKSVYELSEWLELLKQHAIETNKTWAAKLGINPSAAITCVKPSGTVSQLVDSSSGIHPRYSQYYIRTVRADNKDPLTQFLKDQNVPNEPDIHSRNDVTIFSFPIAAPEHSICSSGISAIEQLEHYLVYRQYWCEHNPSITVYVREHEWLEVAAWVYDHFDEIGGISFLPYSDHVYQQAPYQPCSKEQYEEAKAKFPRIDWNRFNEYESEDGTQGKGELACSAGVCEI